MPTPTPSELVIELRRHHRALIEWAQASTNFHHAQMQTLANLVLAMRTALEALEQKLKP
jgi:hypothetical protein